MDGEVWWAAVHGVTRSQTQLSDFTNEKKLLKKIYHVMLAILIIIFNSIITTYITKICDGRTYLSKKNLKIGF